MKTITKHLLRPGITTLTIPEKYRILKIHEQDGRAYIWLEHEELYPDMPLTQIRIEGRATDQRFGSSSTGIYLDSAFEVNFDDLHFYLL